MILAGTIWLVNKAVFSNYYVFLRNIFTGFKYSQRPSEAFFSPKSNAWISPVSANKLSTFCWHSGLLTLWRSVDEETKLLQHFFCSGRNNTLRDSLICYTLLPKEISTEQHPHFWIPYSCSSKLQSIYTACKGTKDRIYLPA